MERMYAPTTASYFMYYVDFSTSICRSKQYSLKPFAEYLLRKRDFAVYPAPPWKASDGSWKDHYGIKKVGRGRRARLALKPERIRDLNEMRKVG